MVNRSLLLEPDYKLLNQIHKWNVKGALHTRGDMAGIASLYVSVGSRTL